ncbi:MAG: exo-alpha-sialidase [Planctomyces sp.]
MQIPLLQRPVLLLLSLLLTTGPQAVAQSATVATSAADGFFSTTVFAAGQHDVSLYRIPGIAVTTRGTILAWCEARRRSKSDWGEIEVHLRRSTDAGRTWSEPQHIAHHGPRIAGTSGNATADAEQTVNNPVAIIDRETQAIEFLYCVNYSRCFTIRSTDDGVTWSAPREITAAFAAFRSECDWKVLATGPGHGIQLRSGRLVVPVWLAYGGVRDHHPSVSATIYSDDHGQTWQAGAIVVPDSGDFEDPNETILTELSDGRVLLISRNESKASRKLVSYSPDGATAWTTPQFHPELWEPICMASVASVPDKPGWVVYSNPYTLARDKQGQEIPGGRGKRENLTIRLSRDFGRTWPVERTLEPGKSAYSDLAFLPDGRLLCFHEADSRLQLAVFPLAWLTGKDQQQ